MQSLGVILTAVTLIALGVIVGIFWNYRRILRRAKGIERGLKMVPILIHLPPPVGVSETGNPVEQARLKIAQSEILYGLLAGLSKKGFSSNFYGQRHLSLEIVATAESILFYAAVPVSMVPAVSQAILTAYPQATLEEVEDHNIFSPTGRLTGTVGAELVLTKEAAYPIETYDHLERDPMEAVLNSLSALKTGEGAAIQIMLRPADPKWTEKAKELVKRLQKQPTSLKFTAKDLIKATVKSPKEDGKDGEDKMQSLSGLEKSSIEAIEEKTKHPGFEVLIRVLVSSDTTERSQALLSQINNSFALLEAPGLNGFKVIPAGNVAGLVTAFIFRFFPPELNSTILNSAELATVFHLPEEAATPTAEVERQSFREVDGPPNLSTQGLLFGYNQFRGERKEVRLSNEDRRRHTYIVGQTGTGKSTMLENLAVQDMLSGQGFAFIDPHGDTAERLLSMVPKNRAEDIIYFNPADTANPLGLNLFEYSSSDQKDFLIQEAIGMLYKLYDPGHTGIIGPRYEHWFRNAALTLMSDPNGATFIEIPKVFTDAAYLKQKFKYVTDQTVIDFWTQEMAQTSDYHKSEMLGWFVSKFGAFMSNEMMRNIIGQTKSAFDLREVMDQRKILIVNLSKGQVGELNSSLLGMMLVIKFQAAAMSRASTPEEQRPDFCLYVDEFQNFSTDSFASILSEARKYRLNLIVANQFIGQLTEEIRTAVFGNVGTIISYRTGPEDADFLVKQFAPVFDARDLVNIPNHQAVIRLMTGGLPSQPFTLQALPPLRTSNAEMGAAVKQLSAAKFGVPRDVISNEIMNRMSSRTVEPSLPPSEAAPAPRPSETPPPPPLPSPPALAVTPPAAPDHGTLNITDIRPVAKPAAAVTAAVADPPAAPDPAVPVPSPAVVPEQAPAPVDSSPSETSVPLNDQQMQQEVNQLLGLPAQTATAAAPPPAPPTPSTAPLPAAPVAVEPKAPPPTPQPAAMTPPSAAPVVNSVAAPKVPIAPDDGTIKPPKPVLAEPLPTPALTQPKPVPIKPAAEAPQPGPPAPQAPAQSTMVVKPEPKPIESIKPEPKPEPKSVESSLPEPKPEPREAKHQSRHRHKKPAEKPREPVRHEKPEQEPQARPAEPPKPALTPPAPMPKPAATIRPINQSKEAALEPKPSAPASQPNPGRVAAPIRPIETVEPKPALVTQQEPVNSGPGDGIKSKLHPGEVYVDEQGNVVQG